MTTLNIKYIFFFMAVSTFSILRAVKIKNNGKNKHKDKQSTRFKVEKQADKSRNILLNKVYYEAY